MRLIFFFLVIPVTVFSQSFGINTDESKVKSFVLPDLLLSSSGIRIETAAQWNAIRRPELIKLFEENVYGKVPAKKIKQRFKVKEITANALGGLAIRKQVTIFFTRSDSGPKLDLLIYVPMKTAGPVPVFLGLNFCGNQCIINDPGVYITKAWVQDGEKYGSENHHALESSRGVQASRWPVSQLLQHGYAVVTAYYGDLDPDFDDGFKNGIHPLFYKKGQTKPAANEWGAIGAWAWGLSRAMDYIEKDKDLDAKKVAVIGHSRLGKAALWAAALDQRFALVISNNSGCGGAKISRRNFGENLLKINTVFPHWFCTNFKKYNNKEDSLPVDQHMLIALIAPRPVYIASAEDDLNADPKGEFLSGVYATPVYQLFGVAGLPVTEMPPVNHPVLSTISYHIRPGKHDITLYDWMQYISFADKFFKP